MKIALDQHQPSKQRFERKDRPKRTERCQYRFAKQVVIGVALQVDRVWADRIVKDFNEELGECVQGFANDVGSAPKPKQGQQEVLRIVDLQRPVIYSKRAQENSRGVQHTRAQENPLSIENRGPSHEIDSMDDNARVSLLDRLHGNARFVIDSACREKHGKRLIARIDEAVRTAMHTKPALNASR